jgi:paraquat-inducible protein B
MSNPQGTRETPTDLPEAVVTRAKWRFSPVWIVPIAALLVTASVIFDRAREFGPNITIQFKDGSGLKPGQTQVRYRGVPVGEVRDVELSTDHSHVLVKVRLRRSVAELAGEGALFWIVRPEVEMANITGLGTVITGPEIQLLPGAGERKSEFVGVERAPVTLEPNELRIVLRARHRTELRRHSPVYYRGVEVGVVQDIEHGKDATTMDISVDIRRRYANLIRSNSVFWNVGGVQVSGGLFRGVEVKVESLRSLLVGGIAFATPNGARAAPVKSGTVFPLGNGPKPEWLAWAPSISLPAEN